MNGKKNQLIVNGKFDGITKAGEIYRAKCLAEEKPVKFVKAKVGNGILSDGEDPTNFTDIKNIKKEVEIFNISQDENAVTLTVQIDNEDVANGYFPCETGIYVDDEGVEVLYWYSNEGTGAPWFPPSTSGAVILKTEFHLMVTNLDSVIVNWTGKGIWVDKEYLVKTLEKYQTINENKLLTKVKTIFGGINELFEELWKTASPTQFGRIKIGKNLSVDKEGFLNADFTIVTQQEIIDLVNKYSTEKRSLYFKEMPIIWDLQETVQFTPEIYMQDDWGIGSLNIILLNTKEKGKIRATFYNENLISETYIIEETVIDEKVNIKIPNEIFKIAGKVFVRLTYRNFEDVILGSTEQIYFYIVAKESWELIEPFIPEVTQKYAQDVIDELYEALNNSKIEFSKYVENYLLQQSEAQEIIDKCKNYEEEKINEQSGN